MADRMGKAWVVEEETLSSVVAVTICRELLPPDDTGPRLGIGIPPRCPCSHADHFPLHDSVLLTGATLALGPPEVGLEKVIVIYNDRDSQFLEKNNNSQCTIIWRGFSV